jgi:hypothetical protein
MLSRHVLHQFGRRISRRYPFLRRFSFATIALIVAWFFAIYVGERSTFASHVQSCSWENWEKWPSDATPHRLVFVSDPQLVDPHTYPGRPWPLSSLTVSFTDRYMARNFRLINDKLDPDSIIFLGDLFDGGREWSTSRARGLRDYQKAELIGLGVLGENEREGQRIAIKDLEGQVVKMDLREFVPGEGGRWKQYGTSQWNADYTRFGRIFFEPQQLYPRADRQIKPVRDVPMDPVATENGAKVSSWQEYAIAGGKQRKVKTGLPGNHDIGFGIRVQIPVRDRFEAHYGPANSLYILGNHTFVSLDSPSLSAADELTDPDHKLQMQLDHIWKPPNDFLNKLETTGPKAVAEALSEFYPTASSPSGYSHEVTDSHRAPVLPPRTNTKDPKPRLPIILLSHVPLFRPDGDDCGPHRERGRSIPISHGFQYQNVLTPGLSTTIARKISETGDLAHVFSGDDHDYCDVYHRFNAAHWSDGEKQKQPVMKSIREITVKSFSWAMGVRRPGFQLVSLWNPVDARGRTIGGPRTTIQSHLCLLPDQLGIFINYAILLGFTFVVLLTRGIVNSVGKPRTSDLDEDDFAVDTSRFDVHRLYRDEGFLPNGRANGYSSPNKTPYNESKGRQRSSSNSAPHAGAVEVQHLGVQRSLNARTRSVSPVGAVVDYAGGRWHDPDQDSDEESRLGVHHYKDDSQAKHDRGTRVKPPSKARRAVNTFVEGLVLVGIPVGLWYGFLVRRG